MKVSRHAKIIELISQYDIETQEELAEYLNNAGTRRHHVWHGIDDRPVFHW